MAFHNCVRVAPLVGRRLCVAAPWQQTRTFFAPWPRPSDIGALVRDMERLERQVFGGAPSWFPRRAQLLPVDIDHTQERASQYRVSVDLAGFKPEEIKLALDDAGRRLTVSAECERLADDGSRFAQQITRVITLPETIDAESLTSMLHRDGVLAIEAPFKEQPPPQQQEQQQPKSIPISRAPAADKADASGSS